VEIGRRNDFASDAADGDVREIAFGWVNGLVVGFVKFFDVIFENVLEGGLMVQPKGVVNKAAEKPPLRL